MGAFDATLGDGDADGGVADFSTIDSSGTASTLFLVLVVIVAVELKTPLDRVAATDDVLHVCAEFVPVAVLIGEQTKARTTYEVALQ